MNAKRHKLPVVFLLLLWAQTLYAVSTVNSVEQGNALYKKDSFGQAILKYDQALVEQPQVLEPKYNKANCFYRLDDLDSARQLYAEVAAESKDMKLVTKAKYNLGNCCFQQGVKQRDSDLQKAVEALKDSIVQWRQVLDIEPENSNAAKNIEVARLMIKDILDQLNKQQKDANQPQDPNRSQNQQQQQQRGAKQDPNKPQEPNQAQQQNQQQSEPNQPKQQPQDKQAQQQSTPSDRTVDDILNKEQQQQQQRQKMQRARYQKVEMDW